MQPFYTQFLDLFRLQMTNWRWSWPGTIMMGMLAPLFLILMLSAFAADGGQEALSYVLIGNVVLSLLLDGLNKVSSHFLFMRINGSLDYFATLPIYRSALILATIAAFLILSLPSVIITLIIGALILQVPLVFNPMVFIIVPLISLSLSGLGAFIGLIGKTPDEVGSISTVITLVLFGLGPVLIPPNRLPDIISTISLVSPSTYAASALRQVVLGQSDRIPLAVDMAVLTLITIGFLMLVGQKMKWRSNR